MPCIQKARKLQSQVLVFCLDPSITFQLRPLLPPCYPSTFLNFFPSLSIYGFLYLSTTSSRGISYFSLFFPIPFTRLHFRIIPPPPFIHLFIHFSPIHVLKPCLPSSTLVTLFLPILLLSLFFLSFLNFQLIAMFAKRGETFVKRKKKEKMISRIRRRES